MQAGQSTEAFGSGMSQEIFDTESRREHLWSEMERTLHQRHLQQHGG